MTIINTTSTQSTIQIPNKWAGVYKIVNFVASFNPDSGDYNENAWIRINWISVTDVSRRQNSWSIWFQNWYIQVNEWDVLEAYSSGYMLNTLSIEITFSKNKRKINNKVYRPLDTYEIGTVQSFLSEWKIDAIFSGEFGLIWESVEERDFNICIGNNNLFSPNHDIMSILSDNAEYSTLPYLTKNINIQWPINNPNKFYAKFLISELTGEFKISVVWKTSYTNGNVPIYFLVNGNQVATTNILWNTINEFSFWNVRIKRWDIISIAIWNDGQVNNSTNIDSIKFYNCLLSSKSVMQII
jgi:hypothetical protein